MGVYSNYMNEAYFGTNRNMEEIIEVLGRFRDKYKIEPGAKHMFSHAFNSKTKVNTDPDLLLFNRMMEKFFGFYIFNLCIDISGIVNGYTLPSTIRSNKIITPKDLVRTNNGYAYIKHVEARCCVYIYSGMIFNSEYTDREIMAVILHEIGHNFSSYFDNTIKTYSYVMIGLKPLAILLDIISLNIGNLKNDLIYINNDTYDFYMNIRKSLFEVPGISFLIDVLSSSKSIANTILYTFITTINVFIPVSNLGSFFAKQLESILSIFTPVTYPARYKDEKIADSFPTMYGLGADQQSLMAKFDDSRFSYQANHPLDSIAKLPVIGWYMDLNAIPIDFILGIVDEHPQSPARVNNAIKYLKNELEKEDVDPKMKKDIQKQIDEMEKYMNESYKKLNGKDGNLIRKIYNIFMIDAFGGDMRETFSNITPKERTKYNRKADDLLDKIEMI